MHVITRKRLNEFASEYPETTTAVAKAMTYLTRHKFVRSIQRLQRFEICRQFTWALPQAVALRTFGADGVKANVPNCGRRWER